MPEALISLTRTEWGWMGYTARGVGNWLQTSVLRHWLDLAAPKCGCEEPEGRKRVSKQADAAHLGCKAFSSNTCLWLSCISPTMPRSCLRTVLKNWSSVHKWVSFVFFFSLSGSRWQLLSWSWFCSYPGCNTEPQLTARGPEQTNRSCFCAHWLTHSMQFLRKLWGFH